MKYRESIKKEKEEYERLYGFLPDTKEELVHYLLEKTKISKEEIDNMIKAENEIPWSHFHLSLKLHPYPTPRPRVLSNGMTYVRGAKKHRKIMEESVTDAKIICTKTHFHVKTYQLLPKSISKKEAILFEMGVYQPLFDPDWDNLGKTYSDMVREILLLNDNIIVKGVVEKFCSIKPRVEIDIDYQQTFDCKANERRVTKTKTYKSLILGESEVL